MPTGNPLDEIIQRLGGVSKVAELTGRSGRFVMDEHKKWVYTRRNADTGTSLANVNIAEKVGRRFPRNAEPVILLAPSSCPGPDTFSSCLFRYVYI